MTETQLVFIGLTALLACDLALVAMRAALLNASLGRLLGRGSQADPRLKSTLALLRAPARLQASLNLVQIILRFLSAGLILFWYSRLPVGANLWLAIILLVFIALVVFWLEWLVRGAVLHQAETWALRLEPAARILMLLLTPLVALPILISGEGNAHGEGASSEVVDELKSLVDAGQEEGVIEKGERKMFYSIFELGDTLAREIMVPRMDILALDVLTPLPQAIDALLETGFTRVPVYEDTVDKVLGLLYAKDLLRVWRQGTHLESLSELLRPAYFVPEAKKVDELMTEMQSQRIHMAVVVDEYGGVAGLVTLEDIVEEVLGEIQDEFDQAEELPYQELPGGEYIFQGRVDLDDFNEVMGSSLLKEEADTLGGLIFSQVGRVPSSGEQVQVDNLLLTVEQVSGRRIHKVRARRISTPPLDEETITHVDG